jgi:hypothetical protein
MYWLPEDTALVVFRYSEGAGEDDDDDIDVRVRIFLLSRSFIERLTTRVPVSFSRLSRICVHRLTLRVTRDLSETALFLEDTAQRHHASALRKAALRTRTETMPLSALVVSPLVLFDACTLYEQYFRRFYCGFSGRSERAVFGALPTCASCGAPENVAETHTPPTVCRRTCRIIRKSVYPATVAFCWRCLAHDAPG